MKFVFFGYDFMVGAAHRLIKDGHELIGIFTFPCDGVFSFNTSLAALAQSLNIPLSDKKPVFEDIEFFIKQGCGLFLCAGYIYKIPAIDAQKAYGINIHPSLLPKGRGLMPTPHILLNHPDASGFTIHKLTEKFDAGDIIYQEPLPLSSHETVESLSIRTALRVPHAISRIVQELPNSWDNAMPQNEKDALYFQPPDETMRTLDFSAGVDQVGRTARAFGRYGSIARLDRGIYIVYALDSWKENHNYAPGTCVEIFSREIAVAAKDGFVCLKDFEMVCS